MLNPGTNPLLTSIVSFGEDTAGELYMVDLGTGAAGTGKIFEITAVPEPTSVAMAGVGMGIVLVRRRRVRKA